MPACLEDNRTSTRPRLSRLAIAGFVGGILWLPIAVLVSDGVLLVAQRCGMAPLHEARVDRTFVEFVVLICVTLALVPAVLLCIVALIRVGRSEGRLRGDTFALLGLVLCILWMLVFILVATVGST